MQAIINDDIAAEAAKYLAEHDAILRPVIERIGQCTIRPHADYYRELVEGIIGQQLSVKAAAAITGRFLELFGGSFPSPEQILRTGVEDMRAVGFSRAKAIYVRDLAQHLLDGKIDFSRFDNLSNQDIIVELTAVKGVGEWTAHMFLMFCMGRTDVLPYGDLGIRNGIYKLYGLEALPDKAGVESIAKQHHWQPYEAVASWYVWQSLDNAPIKI